MMFSLKRGRGTPHFGATSGEWASLAPTTIIHRDRRCLRVERGLTEPDSHEADMHSGVLWCQGIVFGKNAVDEG